MFSSSEGRDLVQGLEVSGRAIVFEFSNLEEITAESSPEPGEWSIKQNLAHLTEIEPGLVDEALAMIADPNTPVGRPPGALWGEAQNSANDQSLTSLVQGFEAVNRDTMSRLSVLTDADLTRRGKHHGLGDVTVQSALTVVLGHRRSHLFQHRSNLISLRTRQDGRVPSEAYSMTSVWGPTLVLLDSASSNWDPVINTLSNEFRIFNYKYAAVPATIEQLRQDLDLRDFWLAGIASGATDACKYAFAYQDRLAGLVLINMPVLPFSRDGEPDDFGRIRVPTLALIGEGYPQVALAQDRGRQFPNGRIVMVSGSGRDVPREQPDAVADAICTFIPRRVGGDRLRSGLA